MNTSHQTIKTIIVDDEKPSLDVLSNYILEYCPSLEIVAKCQSTALAYKAIMEYNPQLVFLDVEMPLGTGFDLLKRFKNINFNVVFVTAFSDYATRAFRVSAIDYLLKPVKVSDLIEAVNKVQQNINQKSFKSLTTLLENLETPGTPVRKLVIPNSKGFQAINPADIILCEADGYCTNFFLHGKLKITSSHHLKFYEEFLPAEMFLRVHNSYIINIGYVTGYSSQGEIQLSEGISCSLSASRKQEFFSVFKKFK